MKIALACSGLGNVRRGYEKFTEDLYSILKPDIDVTLFKGGGRRSQGEVVVPNLRRDGWTSRLPFIRKAGYRDPYYYEVVSFGLALLPHLVAGRYDILHYMDPTLGNLYFYARSKLGMRFRFKTMLTNALALPPEHCTRADFVHHASPVPYDQCLTQGFARDRMALVPLGVETQTYQTTQDVLGWRVKWRIPEDRTVVLCVAALNREHKRVDYLIEEMARLPKAFFLVVAGRLEDRSLVELAQSRLPRRHVLITRPLHDEIAEIYSLSDIAVSTSLTEGFGLGIVEAMCAGLPVVMHRNAHFRWLGGPHSCRIDMTRPGELAGQIASLAADREGLVRLGQTLKNQARRRFDWSNLREHYIAMYRDAQAITDREGR
jgi:glycosyltransferase involved in cell wall biosynthesis